VGEEKDEELVAEEGRPVEDGVQAIGRRPPSAHKAKEEEDEDGAGAQTESPAGPGGEP